MVKKTTNASQDTVLAHDAQSVLAMKASDDIPAFETALAQLESLVSQMERGDLPLEQSLKAYAKGVELVALCQKSLDAAEQQVQVLQDNLLRSLNDTALDDEDQ